MKNTLQTVLQFSLDFVVLTAVVLLAYLDKIPTEIVISVVSVYAGAVGARRAMGGSNGAPPASGSIVGMLFAGMMSSGQPKA